LKQEKKCSSDQSQKEIYHNWCTSKTTRQRSPTDRTSLWLVWILDHERMWQNQFLISRRSKKRRAVRLN